MRSRGAVPPHCRGFGGAATLNMLRRATPAGWMKSVWWEARKRLKKGIVPREAVG